MKKAVAVTKTKHDTDIKRSVSSDKRMPKKPPIPSPKRPKINPNAHRYVIGEFEESTASDMSAVIPKR